MTKLEYLEQYAKDESVDVIYYPFASDQIKGLYCNNTIALNRMLSYKEKACILAEEIAHHDLNVGNITDQSDGNNRWQEHKARMMSYDRMVGLRGLINCFEAGDRNLYEMADRLDVPDWFLKEVIEGYRLRYGEGVQVDNFVLSFEPYFNIIEILD